MEFKIGSNNFLINKRIQETASSTRQDSVNTSSSENRSNKVMGFEEYYQREMGSLNTKIDAIVRVNGEIAAILYEGGSSAQYGLKLPSDIASMTGESRMKAISDWLRSSGTDGAITNYLGMSNQPTVKDLSEGKLFTDHEIALGWKGGQTLSKAEIRASWEEQYSFEHTLAKYRGQ